MGFDLSYLSRRGMLEQGYICDDLREMYPCWYPSEVRDVRALDFKSVAKDNGFKVEIYWIPFEHRYVMFGVNGKGFRYHLMFMVSLNGDELLEFKKICYYNKNFKRYAKETQRANREASDKRVSAKIKEFNDITADHIRTFRGLNRLLGEGDGKVYQPYGMSGSVASASRRAR